MTENQAKYKTEKWFKRKLEALQADPNFRLEEAILEIGEQKVLIDAMRSNIAAKEAIWGSLIRDNMELEKALRGITDAYCEGNSAASERAIERALKLVKGGG